MLKIKETTRNSMKMHTKTYENQRIYLYFLWFPYISTHLFLYFQTISMNLHKSSKFQELFDVVGFYLILVDFVGCCWI